MRRILFLTAILAMVATPANAQDSISSGELRVFLDCDWSCDREFIRSEITLVDYVNDREVADVHLLITAERTGSGGRVYSLAFIGLGEFSALSDTLSFTSVGYDSDDERRRGVARTIQAGLIRYIARTPLISDLEMQLKRSENEVRRTESAPAVDPWNYWVFSIGGNGEVEGEESSDGFSIRGRLSANRTTEAWKIRAFANGDYRERHFYLDDGKLTSITRSGSLWLMSVKSLGDHWSAGGTIYVSTSSRNNTQASITTGPAIEWNLFPYSESTRREFRFQYGVRWDRVGYDEITVFGLTAESILKHTFQASLDVQQPWGELGFDAEINHLLTNFDRSLTGSYRLELDAGADVRISRGLSVSFGGRFERIRDQLFLPLSDVSEEEILLGTRRLPTGYDFSVRVGFNYRFGSIYNNVVNPRFGF